MEKVSENVRKFENLAREKNAEFVDLTENAEKCVFGRKNRRRHRRERAL